ncbi:MAG: tetratricopeptide repeat protein [Gemmataceae bacterium]|nr:tetratricopeptide repeat protein [Gemmataceae bacterium]
MTLPSVEALFAEAVGRHQAGDLPAAERLYRDLLATTPHHPGALSNLGVVVARRDPAEAERLYAAALAADPARADAHFNLGNLLRKQDRPAEAAAAYQAVLQLAPDHPRAYLNLGLAAGDLGDWAAAAECFHRAVQLDPASPDGYNLLGDALYRTGQLPDAVAAFREVVARHPDDPRGRHNLGLAFAAGGAFAEAAAELDQALRLRPDYPEAHNALGVALEALGRADDALAHYRRATELQPDGPDAWTNRGTTLAEQGRVAEAAASLRRALDLRPDPRTGSGLIAALAHSSDITPEQLRDEALAWAGRYTAPADRPKPRRPDPDRRLKVGTVVGDARTLTAAGPVEQLLGHHDRAKFHLTAYPNAPRADDLADRLRRRVDAWRPAGGLSDDQLADAIRADEIDILVDLCGHTAGNRLPVFALRPAPVQLTLFNLAGTTGLSAIDFRLTDPFTDPPGQTDHLYAEKLVRLPEVSWVYSPPADAPEPADPPSASGGPFTFACLNHPAKLSEGCLDTWAAVLKAVPGSRLVLTAGRSADAAGVLAGRFAAAGVEPDRLDLIDRLPAGDYYGAYRLADVALDPFPCNGGVTTCDALWMGVPVLTVAGGDARGRQGVSLLTNLGLPEFVADSPGKLVELAATWAGQRAALADLRGCLREMVRQSPLTAAGPFARHVEAAYRAAWRAVL